MRMKAVILQVQVLIPMKIMKMMKKIMSVDVARMIAVADVVTTITIIIRQRDSSGIGKIISNHKGLGFALRPLFSNCIGLLAE